MYDTTLDKSCSLTGIKYAAVALGNFDGPHLGHMRLISTLINSASRLGLPAVAYTFDEHPINVLAGPGRVKMLADTDKKVDILTRAGVNGVLTDRFTHEFAATTPYDFARHILAGRLGVRLVVVGENYRFGCRGEGDVRALHEFGRKFGFAVEVVKTCSTDMVMTCSADMVMTCSTDKAMCHPAGNVMACSYVPNTTISSSLIRSLLASGQTEESGRLLGRLYSLRGAASGVVMRAGDFADSDKFKVAAMRADPRMATPGVGVYDTRVKVGGSFYRAYSAVFLDTMVSRDTAISEHIAAPHKTAVSSENVGQQIVNYISDYHSDLHGDEIEVFFNKRVRPAGLIHKGV